MEARRGMRNSGVFIILSFIPYIGFIFMFMLASSSSRIAGGVRGIGIGTHKAPNRLSSIATITGLGMFLALIITSSHLGGYVVHITPNFHTSLAELVYDMEILWFPVFITLEMGTLTSFSSRGTGAGSTALGLLFIFIFMGISFHIPGYGSYIIIYTKITEIFIALIFIINYLTTGAMQKKRLVKMNGSEGRPGVSAGNDQDSGNRGYKPQFQKTVRSGNVENTSFQRNPTGNGAQREYILSREEQRNTIAIIGPPGAGKTTFLAYFFHFLSNIEATLNVNSDVTSGIELMDEYINRIFSESKFPQLTAKDRVGEVIFKFTRKRRLSQKSVILRINDIAGETFNSLQGGRDQIRRLIFGTRFEYLLRARAYVVMIDCSTFTDWAAKDMQYRRMIEAIIEARLEKKIQPRILFLFTKTDTLPEEAFVMSPLELT
jgi:ABC-type thiamine transport system, ATPase component